MRRSRLKPLRFRPAVSQQPTIASPNPYKALGEPIAEEEPVDNNEDNEEAPRDLTAIFENTDIIFNHITEEDDEYTMMETKHTDTNFLKYIAPEHKTYQPEPDVTIIHTVRVGIGTGLAKHSYPGTKLGLAWIVNTKATINIQLGITDADKVKKAIPDIPKAL